jgi:hypothetical protein
MISLLSPAITAENSIHQAHSFDITPPRPVAGIGLMIKTELGEVTNDPSKGTISAFPWFEKFA